MTRKHYVAIAAEIADLREQSSTEQRHVLRSLSYRLAEVAKSDNPRFDRDRFIAACGFAAS